MYTWDLSYPPKNGSFNTFHKIFNKNPCWPNNCQKTGQILREQKNSCFKSQPFWKLLGRLFRTAVGAFLCLHICNCSRSGPWFWSSAEVDVLGIGWASSTPINSEQNWHLKQGFPRKNSRAPQKKGKLVESNPTILFFWLGPSSFLRDRATFESEHRLVNFTENPRKRDHPKRSKHCDNVRICHKLGKIRKIPKKKFVIQLNITLSSPCCCWCRRFLSKHYNFTTQLSCIASSHCPPAVLNGGDKKQLHLWQVPRQEDCVFPQVAASQRDILLTKKSFQTATQYLSVWSI